MGLSWLLLMSLQPLPPSIYDIGLGADTGMVGDEHPHDIPRWSMMVTIIAPGCRAICLPSWVGHNLQKTSLILLSGG